MKDLIKSVTTKSDEYDKNFIEMKFDSDNGLPLNKKDKDSQHGNSCQSYFL